MMFWIDTKDGRYTITGKANREIKVHGICDKSITVTITLNGGAVIDGKMNLNEFINMITVD